MNLYSYNNKLFSTFILFILLSSLVTIQPVFSVGSEAVNVTFEDIVADSINGVGDNFVVDASSFPASATLDVYVASVKLGTMTADSTGAVKKSFAVPELPGGTHVIIVKDIATGFTASDDVVLKPTLKLEDSSGSEIVSTSYLKNSSSITVTGYGFASLENVTLTENGSGSTVNLVDKEWITNVSVGTLQNDVKNDGSGIITADHNGSFKFTYTTTITKVTSTIITLTADSNTYLKSGTFLASASIKMDFTLSPVTPGKTDIELRTTNFDNLASSTPYSLRLDGAIKTFTLDGVTDQTSFTKTDDKILITAPTTTGSHRITTVLKDQSDVLDSILLIVSEKGGTAGFSVILTDTNLAATGESTTKVVVDEPIVLALYNFNSSETISAYISSSDKSQNTIKSNAITDDEGAQTISYTVQDSAGGEYVIWLTRSDSTNIQKKVTIVPSLKFVSVDGSSVSDSYSVKNNVRATVKLSTTGLDPYSAYNVLFNNQVVDNSIFTTNKYGGNTAIEFKVPLIKDGDYKVQLTKASESTAITTYKGDNTESSLTYTIVSDIVFKPSSTFIADQMVFFSWDSDIDAGSAFKTITIKLDDTTILNGQINSTEFKGTAGAVSVDWTDEIISGSFVMPNGDADKLVEVKLTLDTTSTYSAITRSEGSGAFNFDSKTLENDVNLLSNDVSSLSNDVSSLSNKIDIVEALVNAIPTSSTSSEDSGDVSSITAKLIILDNSIKELYTLTDESKTRVNKAIFELMMLETLVIDNTEVRNDSGELKPVVKGIQSDLAEVKSDLLEALTVVDQHIYDNADSISTINSNLLTIPNKFDVLESELQNTSTKISTLDVNITTIPDNMMILLMISILQLVVLGSIVIIILRR